MDAGIAAAARSMANGDVLGALKWVSTRKDPPALAMRGIVMARLGEVDVARDLLRRAASAFAKTGETVARARCIVASAEIDLADRALAKPNDLAPAIRVLDRSDPRNAAWARLVVARRAIALGDLPAAMKALERASSDFPLVRSVRALAECEIALRRLDPDAATEAASRAREAARAANAPALEREVESLANAIDLPVARIVRSGQSQDARLRDIQALDRFSGIVVDMCRRRVRSDRVRDLRTRPIPLAIVRVLAEAWPRAAPRAALILDVFGVQRPNDSHRARLRVEVGRARRLAGADIEATGEGFRLVADDACVLAPPDTTAAGDVLALLEQGGAWPVSSLAAALGKSLRTVQRALGALEGRVEPIGKGRSQRWVMRSPIASRLLLPGLFAAGS